MSQQDSFNPYQAPDTAIQVASMPPLPGETLWRDGDDLLCVRDTPFPARCVKCGAALRNDELKKRTFYWHAPGWYVLILVSVVIYAIAALIARKRSSHVLGICAEHRRRRNRFVLLAAAAFVAGPLLGFAVGDEAGLWLGLAVFLAMLIAGMFGARILVPRRMDERYARYKGVAPAFLARLPTLPAALRR
ncbi:MFS family permease [Xanthomonas translucens]